MESFRVTSLKTAHRLRGQGSSGCSLTIERASSRERNPMKQRGLLTPDEALHQEIADSGSEQEY